MVPGIANKFWMIKGSGSTSVIYYRRESVLAEAIRIARITPNEVIFILEVVDAVVKTPEEESPLGAIPVRRV